MAVDVISAAAPASAAIFNRDVIIHFSLFLVAPARPARMRQASGCKGYGGKSADTTFI
ncbi:hypothetical protein [Roseovarius sp.]|uniref:hypothetical protein n=1 Tax=Roseovarius sp. TaxID=1486281 RepID=UPI003B598B42